MVSLEAVQEQIVQFLLANPTVAGLLGTEIRESEWQGTQFSYPCARVKMLSGGTYTKTHCRNTHTQVLFDVIVFSEMTSSQEVNIIMGEIVGELLEVVLEGLGTATTNPFYTSPIELAPVGRKAPAINAQNVWVVQTSFSTHVHERT